MRWHECDSASLSEDAVVHGSQVCNLFVLNMSEADVFDSRQLPACCVGACRRAMIVKSHVLIAAKDEPELAPERVAFFSLVDASCEGKIWDYLI